MPGVQVRFGTKIEKDDNDEGMVAKTKTLTDQRNENMEDKKEKDEGAEEQEDNSNGKEVEAKEERERTEKHEKDPLDISPDLQRELFDGKDIIQLGSENAKKDVCIRCGCFKAFEGLTQECCRASGNGDCVL